MGDGLVGSPFGVVLQCRILGGEIYPLWEIRGGDDYSVRNLEHVCGGGGSVVRGEFDAQDSYVECSAWA